MVLFGKIILIAYCQKVTKAQSFTKTNRKNSILCESWCLSVLVAYIYVLGFALRTMTGHK